MFQAYLSRRESEVDQIPDERRLLLDPLAEFVAARVRAEAVARLTFICTHNSRRSQMAQVLASAVARRYGIAGVEAFSGGTEVTAFHPNAVAALRRAGVHVGVVTPGDNPTYDIAFDPEHTLLARSKTFADPVNPSVDFCAVMTCTEADEACPVVPGATLRLSIPYDDPKAFDGTPHEVEQYDARCRQIAREMVYVGLSVCRAVGLAVCRSPVSGAGIDSQLKTEDRQTEDRQTEDC